MLVVFAARRGQKKTLRSAGSVTAGWSAGQCMGAQVRGGVEAMAAFADNLALCDIGVSLGDVFTLVYTNPKRGGLIRVSVGCEDVDDLVEDFTRGLSFVA